MTLLFGGRDGSEATFRSPRACRTATRRCCSTRTSSGKLEGSANIARPSPRGASSPGLLIVWPPINKPGDKYPLGPPDYMMMVAGLYSIAIYVACIGLGLSIWGRTPVQMMIRDRIARFNRRYKRLRHINNERKRRIGDGEALKPRGSELGFRTQVDPMSGWVRTWENRAIGTHTGCIAVGIDGDARASLAKNGVRAPDTRSLIT